MQLDAETLAAAPEPIRRRYEAATGAEKERWAKALVSTVRQRAHVAPRPAPVASKAIRAPVDEWQFVTAARLTEDAMALVPALAGVDAVVGIARSGLLPASLVAFALHRPLYSVNTRTGVLDVGHGVRLEGLTLGVKRVALIDDTAARGVAMAEALPLVRDRWPDAEITRAVVYCHPHARNAVDLCVSEYPGLHYLEWNWCNAGHGVGCAYDFDGILCRDIKPDDDDDGTRYEAAIRNAPPLFLPRREPIPLIVTARHDRYRALTLDWLARHGVACDRLVMREWEWQSGEWDAARVARFKAEHYKASGLTLFAESDADQARVIADESGKPVLCPAAGRVLLPSKAASAAESVKLWRRIRACPHREDCGCTRWKCHDRGGERVGKDDCQVCPKLPENPR